MKRGCGRAILAGMAAAFTIGQGICGGIKTFAAEHDPAAQGYLTADFEDDYQPFRMRGGKEIELVTEAQDPNHVMLITGHAGTWDGPSVDVTDWLVPGCEYTFTAYAKYAGNEDQKLNLSIELDTVEEGTKYQSLKSGIPLPANVWKRIKYNFTAPSTAYHRAQIYVESGTGEIFDYMLDEITIKPAEGESMYAPALATYSLKDTYQDYFKIGMSFLTSELKNEHFRKMFNYQFNSGTMGNELKPDYVLDKTASQASADGSPEINYEKIDSFMTLAQESGIPMRGHVLVWHSQTPEWFFKVGYDENNYDVDSATMEWRMEQYIQKVLTYTQSKYPGVIYAWDVVNEAADDNGGYRKISGWYRIMGEGFIEKAFTYARKYADPGVKLFYNDYNEYYPAKRQTIYNWVTDLQSKGLIDGIGMQSHVDLAKTAVSDYLETVELYGSTGLEVQVTELDIHNPDKGIAGQMKLADKYAAIFSGLCDLKRSGKVNLTAVTIWGFSDDITWLTDNRGEKSYPLLFDEEGQPKEAFRAVIDVLVPGVRESYQKKY